MSKLIALGIVVIVSTSVVAWSASNTSRTSGGPEVSAFSTTEIYRGIDVRALPETQMHDMTFVFVEGE